MKTNNTYPECLIDNHHGLYIPQIYAKRFAEFTKGVSKETLDDLLAGPESETYFDSWSDVLDNGTLVSNIDGKEYRLIIGEGAGDVFIVPSEWEHDDATDTWGEPESDTLRRFTLPTHWACQLANGDDDGLTDQEWKDIAGFLESENLQFWTLADVSESHWFAHRNDAGTLACDVSRFTFIRIP
jgi:hypothetical protein